MQTIIVASYLTVAAAFLVGTLLLALGWHRQRTGTLLIAATLAMALWGAFLAFAAWQHSIAVNWLLLAEVLRYGAWLVFLGALFHGWAASGVLRGVRVAGHALWIALALYCLLPALGLALPFAVTVVFVGMLGLGLVGLLLLEQLFRGVAAEQRWAIKFLVIALAVMFAYDIFLYSYALLYVQFNTSAWAARGFIDAVLVPLLLVAAARNPTWSLNVGVSRRAVFYSTSLLVVAVYLIATAIGGYVVRLYGGNWGRVAAITLVCLALLGVLLLASSGAARSRLRLFLHKNFFSLRHDYREEWLRLTATLAKRDLELPQRALRALAQTMDSPAGALFMRNDSNAFIASAHWNLATPPGLALAATEPAFEWMHTRRWIYDLDAPPPLGDPHLRAPAELAALPRAWLLVPLALGERLIGFVLLAQARAPHALDWEDLDLLRAASSQVAAALAQAADARQLAEARQFEGFNRLTAFLMHDLKNIAAQQSLLLQNAERHKHNPAFVDDMLATVANAVQRVQRLLEQLRGEAAGNRMDRVRLARVLDKALAECSAQLPHPEAAPAPAAAWVRADLGQLATVLGHVLRNAQDAAMPNGHVKLKVACDSGQAVITVEDDGAGMDEDFIRERLFQPFFTTKASKGMGVGAYQARAYVHALGGTVRVDSTPGAGTAFHITLPLAEPAPATPPTANTGVTP